MNVYSLFDRKLLQYGQLVLERNDFGVQRGLCDGIRAQPDSLLSKHPEDFDLYQVAEFDDESGVVTALVPPRFVSAVSVVLPVPVGEQLSLLKKEG